MHAHHNSPNLLSDEDAAKCRPWQTFTDPPPGELFSARYVGHFSQWILKATMCYSFENPVPAGGTFAFRTNISSSFPDAHSLRSISGTFTLSFYRAPSIEQALLSLQVQASTRQLRERVYVCFANDTQSGETNVDIYVGANQRAVVSYSKY